jgi:hypothetical protein
VGAHGGDSCRPRVIQVDENVTSVPMASVGLHIDITAFTVAYAQKTDRGRSCQLLGSPQSFAGERLPSSVVNQADQVELARHGGQLSANGLPGEKENRGLPYRGFCSRNQPPYNELSADGELCLNCLSQPRGQAHLETC